MRRNQESHVDIKEMRKIKLFYIFSLINKYLAVTIGRTLMAEGQCQLSHPPLHIPATNQRENQMLLGSGI